MVQAENQNKYAQEIGEQIKSVTYQANEDARSNGTKKHTYDEALKIIGFGCGQRKIITMCALMMLMNMNELMGISVISIAAHYDLQLDNSRKGIVHACALWGKVVSSFFLGHLSDRFGRRSVLIYSTILANMFSFASMLMTNFWLFVWLRFSMGVCAGGAMNIAFIYLSEFITQNQTEFLLNYINMSHGVSYVYTSIVAYVVLKMDWAFKIIGSLTFRPWRLLILFNLLPGLIAVLLLLQFPESPRLLLALGKHDDAFVSADWVCRQNHEGLGLREFQVNQLSDAMENQTKNCITVKLLSRIDDTLQLFKLPYVWNLFVCCIVFTGTLSVSLGLGLWYPVIQNDLLCLAKDNLTQTMCDVLNGTSYMAENVNDCDNTLANKSLLEDFGFGVIYIFSYTFLTMFVSTTRRKLVIVCLLGLSGICGLTLIKLTNKTLIMLTFSFYLVFADLSASLLISYTIDLMPTELSAQASFLAKTIGRITASMTAYAIGLYLQTHCMEAFTIFAQLILVWALFANFLSQKIKALNSTNSFKMHESGLYL